MKLKTFVCLNLICLITSMAYASFEKDHATINSDFQAAMQHETHDYSSFESIKNKNFGGSNESKFLHRHLITGRLWMIDTGLLRNGSIKYYLTAGLYQLMMGKDRSPNVQLIQEKDGTLMLGSEFIPGFVTLESWFRSRGAKNSLEAFNEYNCFASTHSSEEILKHFGFLIEGIEELLASMVLLGDVDGNMGNVGLIPHPSKKDVFLTAKIDHEHAMCNMNSDSSFLDLSLQVERLGHRFAAEGVSVGIRSVFSPVKIYDALTRIDQIPNHFWRSVIDRRMDQIDSIFFRSSEERLQMVDQLMRRKGRVQNFAADARIELAILENDTVFFENAVPKVDSFFFTSSDQRESALSPLELAILHGKESMAQFFMEKILDTGIQGAQSLEEEVKAARLRAQRFPIQHGECWREHDAELEEHFKTADKDRALMQMEDAFPKFFLVGMVGAALFAKFYKP